MPFTALFEGVRVDALRADPDAWKHWKANREKLSFDCCKETAIPKRSKLSKQFFAHHSTSSCTAGLETPEHRQLKAAVLHVAEKLGHRAETEYPFGGELRADVIVHLSKPLVFEVQHSNQTMEVTRLRTKEYRDRGVEVIWLMRRIPTSYRMKSSEHIVQYRVGGEDIEVHTPARQRFTLAKFVEGILRYGVRIQPAMLIEVAAEDMMEPMHEPCIRCNQQVLYAHIWRKLRPTKVCGQKLEGNFTVEWQSYVTIDAVGLRDQLRKKKWYTGYSVAKPGKGFGEVVCPCGVPLSRDGNGLRKSEHKEFQALLPIRHWCIHDENVCTPGANTVSDSSLGLFEVQRRIDYDLNQQRIRSERRAKSEAFLRYRSECLTDGETVEEFNERMQESRVYTRD